MKASVAAAAILTLLAASCSGARTENSAPHTPPSRVRMQHPFRVKRPRVVASNLDGRIAFTDGEMRDIYTMNADGTNVRRLTHRHGPEFDPSWSPDGRQIVYRDSRRGININDEIYVMDADGRHQRNISHNPANDWGPAWSPRGDLIAFSSERGGHAPRIYTMKPDGSDVRRLTDVEGEYPAWSPDGTRLAFMSMEPDAHGFDPDYNIRVMNADGSGLRRLTDYRGEDGWPDWSKDGRTIAFETTRDDTGGLAGPEGPYTTIYRIAADGTGLARLTRLFSHTPKWSPGGDLILFSGAGLPSAVFSLCVVRPDGSDARRIQISAGVRDAFDADWTA